MNKRINRVFALAILCCVLAAVSISASAAGAIDPEQDVLLTIAYEKDGTKISGARFDLYRVADVDAYAQMTLTERFAGYPIAFDGLDQSGWNVLATTLKGYVWSDSLAADHSATTDAAGTLQESLKPGLYLVLGNQRTINDRTYSAAPFLLFLPGENTEQNSWDYAVTAYPKASVKKESSDHPSTPTTITRKVLKIWDDAGKEESRPEEITIHLLCDGKQYATAKLSEANNWRYTWNNLNQNHDWLVTEETVSGYTQAVSQEGITFTVTNTVKPDTPPDPDPTQPPAPTDSPQPTESPQPTNSPQPTESPSPVLPTDPKGPNDPGSPKPSGDTKLPQTGLLWWPVFVLPAGGLVLIVIGLVRRKGESCE